MHTNPAHGGTLCIENVRQRAHFFQCASSTACYIFINSKAAPCGGRHEIYFFENRLASSSGSGNGFERASRTRGGVLFIIIL
jgi:hypothetical protein